MAIAHWLNIDAAPEKVWLVVAISNGVSDDEARAVIMFTYQPGLADQKSMVA